VIDADIPVGRLVSLTNETTWFADCTAASWPTRVWFAGFVGFGVQLYVLET
jgi:hypothetical protein